MKNANLKKALNRVSEAGYPTMACCLDAEPGSYCDENDSQQKKCKMMNPFQCLAAGGVAQGFGSRCSVLPGPGGPGERESCCDGVVIEDVFCACCHGPKDRPRCRTLFGPKDLVDARCQNMGGTCQGDGAKCDQIECPIDGGGIDPQPGR